MRQLLSCLFILLLATSCQSPENDNVGVTPFSELAMGIPYRIVIGKKLNRKESAAAYRIISDTFDEVNRVYNNWNPESEISQLNKSPAGVAITLSEKLERLLLLTSDLVHLSGGRFDPTVAPLSQLWKEALQQGHLPDANKVSKAQSTLGWGHLKFEEGYVIKEREGTSLDLGGVAKGYAVDLLVENLVDGGYHDVYVEWGGEIRTAGRHPDARPWTIFISKLDDTNPDHAVDILQLDGCGVATSGNYLQNWSIGESHYTHIIDPVVMKPLDVVPARVCSVTVRAPTCLIADVLATAAMIFPTREEAETWAKEIQETDPDITFWFQSQEQ